MCAQFVSQDFRALSTLSSTCPGAPLKLAGDSPFPGPLPAPQMLFSAHESCVCADILKPFASTCQMNSQDRVTPDPIKLVWNFLSDTPTSDQEGCPGRAVQRGPSRLQSRAGQQYGGKEAFLLTDSPRIHLPTVRMPQPGYDASF